MGGIIRKVVDGRHGGELVKALNEHTFCIEIGEAHRTYDFVTTMLFSPFFCVSQKRTAHFKVVYKVNPTKTCILGLPRCIGFVVDETRHTPYDNAFTFRQKEFRFTEVISSVLLWIEGIQHIFEQIRHGVCVVLIKFVVKTNKLLEFVLCSDFLNVNWHDNEEQGCAPAQ